jgi:maltooligosyltrehalose trehalohydrolase
VHGASTYVDAPFEWTDSGFKPTPLQSAVIYELHVGTFAADSTFDGVIERLGYLKRLGITHVEIMPIAQFPGEHGWGYDGVDLYAPHSRYGGPVAFKRLVNACHTLGLSVVLDVVYNHFGPDGNYLTQFGPYLTLSNATPWGAAVNFDGQNCEGVRRFVIDNALYWFDEYHLDGLRLDAVHAIQDRSSRHILADIAEETLKLSLRLEKPLALTAESDLNDPRLVHSRSVGGYGLDAMWNDDFHHALHVVLTGERGGIYADFHGLAELARTLEKGFVYDGKYSEFRKRPVGSPMGDTSLRRLIGFMQNHDQVGNRANGERISMLISHRRARLGALLVLLGPFIPLVFQGEEFASTRPFLYFVDHENGELARAVSEGRRKEFAVHGCAPENVPDPSERRTFEASRLDFEETLVGEHAAMLEFYTSLIRIRSEHPDWTSPVLKVNCDEVNQTLVIVRDTSVLAINFGDNPVRFLTNFGDWNGSPQIGFSTEGVSLDSEGLLLPGESGVLCVPAAPSLG